jgi:hypothetical protein
MARKMPVYAVRLGEAEAGQMLNAGLTVITDSFPDSGASALSGLGDRIRFVAPVSAARPGEAGQMLNAGLTVITRGCPG